MKSSVIKTHSSGSLALVVPAAVFCLLLAAINVPGAGRNSNPGVAPINSSAYGHTYGEWAGAWWQWAVGIPAAENPILDTTGEFGHIDQEGPVFFLAGSFGSTEVRDLTIANGKSLFFPIFNSLWWAPEDLETAILYVETQLGLDAEDFTYEELIRLTAIGQVKPEELEMTCTVDGNPLSNLESYLAVSPGFQITDTALLDDFGIPISQPNTAVGAGYWIMLSPLSKGEHTIQFTVSGSDPFWGESNLDVTYHLEVE